MSIHKKNDQISIIFLIFYSLYCLKTGIFSLKIEMIGLDWIKLALNIILTGFSVITFFKIKSNKTKLFFILFFILFIINLSLKNNDYYFGFLFLISLLILSSNITWKSLLNLIIISQVTSLLLITPIILLSENFFYHDDRFGERFTAGFDNPNSIAQYFLSILCVFLLKLDCSSKIPSKKIIFSLFLFVIFSILIYTTQSRTALFLMSIVFPLFLVSLFIPTVKNKYLKIKIIVISFSISILLFQFISTILYNQYTLIISLNELLSGRIWYSNNIYSSVGYPTLFMGMSISEYLPLDFYYIQAMYGLGLIPFLFLYILVLRRLIISPISFFMLMVFILMILETLTETYFSIPYYSVALFIIFNKHSDNINLVDSD